MSDARDTEIARIDAELVKVRAAMSALTTDAQSGNYLNWVSSRSEDSAFGSGGGAGGSVMSSLMAREKMLLEQKEAATLWDENVPLAIGHDVTGGDETETNLS